MVRHLWPCLDICNIRHTRTLPPTGTVSGASFHSHRSFICVHYEIDSKLYLSNKAFLHFIIIIMDIIIIAGHKSFLCKVVVTYYTTLARPRGVGVGYVSSLPPFSNNVLRNLFLLSPVMTHIFTHKD